MKDNRPVLILIGGINGAGKTTLYYEQIKPLLDKSGRDYPFVNADEMEKAKFPNEVGKHSLEMGKLAAKIRDQYLEAGQSFVTETVFSHESKNQLIDDAQKAGFKVMLNHVHVDSPDVAYKRVQTCVQKGGHSVPKDKVFSLYDRTVTNIQKASMVADQTYVWDNSCSQGHDGVTHRFPLRQRMFDDMVMHKLNHRIQECNICAIVKLYLKRSPDTATADELRDFQIHMANNGVGPGTINATITGLRFFFETTLDSPERVRKMCHVHEPRK